MHIIVCQNKIMVIVNHVWCLLFISEVSDDMVDFFCFFMICGFHFQHLQVPKESMKRRGQGFVIREKKGFQKRKLSLMERIYNYFQRLSHIPLCHVLKFVAKLDCFKT